jgi:hypothetical protein
MSDYLISQNCSGLDGIGIVELQAGVLSIPQLTQPTQPKYTHLEPIASSIWTINHNLGFRPIVQVYTLGGSVLVCDILQASINQVILNFSTPIAGYAQLN